MAWWRVCKHGARHDDDDDDDDIGWLVGANHLIFVLYLLLMRERDRETDGEKKEERSIYERGGRRRTNLEVLSGCKNFTMCLILFYLRSSEEVSCLGQVCACD